MGGAAPNPTRRNSTCRPGVLLVDDDESVRAVVAMLLEHLGFTAYQAASGAAAREILSVQRAEIHGILLDWLLPGEDGPQILGALRQVAPAVPVVVMSGNLSTAAAAEFTRLGTPVHLQKPFGMQQLSAALSAVGL